MLVRYQRTLADLEAQYDFYSELAVTKKAIARYRTRSSIAIGVLISGVSYLAFTPGYPLLSLGIGTVAALIFASRAPSIYKRAVRQSIRRSFAPNSGAYFDSEVELELLETGVIVRTDRMETKFTWKALKGIESRPGYTFLCIDALNAVSIPHKGIVSGDFPALLTELGRRYQSVHLLESNAE